jgi:DNA invertase Pin-like site-specific DNA recombinase
MKVFYSRISDVSQNDARQLQNLDGFDYVLSDKCSGLIHIWDRPKGSQIKKLLDSNQLTTLEIHSLDRLGRSTIQCLEVYRELTEAKVNVICRNPNLRNFDENGKPDMFSELLMSIIVIMSSYEKSLIRERQLAGIKLRKEQFLYTGRAINSKEKPENFIKKEKNQKIIQYLKREYPFSEICKILSCSASTINKVKKVAKSLELL